MRLIGWKIGNSIWNMEEMPEEGKESVNVPLGNVLVGSDYDRRFWKSLETVEMM
jgi:hypothetical protein